ncbi:MAG TPA: anti-sigma factor [Gemmatimonadales bacterium]|nr:anti-sigma factor [Gemmatimonadales bacterium]
MTSPEHADPRELSAAYALGALPPDEARAFEAFLATSAAAQQEVAEFRETAALLALPDERAPARELKQRVLDAIGAPTVRPFAPTPDEPARRTRRVAPLVWGALAASLIAAIGLGFRARTLSHELAARGRALSDERATVGRQQQRMLQLERTLSSIFAPGVELVQLTQSGNPEPRIQLFWDRNRNLAVLHAANLRPTPQGRTYQLWFIRDGKPVPSATFDVEAGGSATVPEVSVPAEGKISAAAVTEEPAGGSQQPTSPILLVGTLPES